MLDPKNFRDNFEEMVARLRTRGGTLDLEGFQARMAERRALHVSMEAAQAKRNTANEEMKRAAKEDPKTLERLRGDLRVLKENNA